MEIVHLKTIINFLQEMTRVITDLVTKGRISIIHHMNLLGDHRTQPEGRSVIIGKTKDQALIIRQKYNQTATPDKEVKILNFRNSKTMMQLLSGKVRLNCNIHQSREVQANLLKSITQIRYQAEWAAEED